MMRKIWVIECDNDQQHVTLYTESLMFLSKDGVVEFDFEYDTAIAKEIIKAEMEINEVVGHIFTPYLNVIGAKGLFVDEK